MTIAHERANRFKQWINSEAVFTATGHDLKYADHPTTAGTVGALVGHLDRVCRGERHAFLFYLFGVASSKGLTVRQRNALLAWLAPRKFEMGDPIPPDYEFPDLDANLDKGFWLVRRKCLDTAAAVVEVARLQAGQAQITWEVTEKVKADS